MTKSLQDQVATWERVSEEKHRMQLIYIYGAKYFLVPEISCSRRESDPCG
jgi:hypothetical protein